MDISDFVPLTSYEVSQIDLIRKWKNEEPGVLSRAFGVISAPISWLVNRVIPEAAIRGALDCANAIGQHLADSNDIKKDADINSISELRFKDLELSDKLANEIHNWAIGIAGAEGGCAGFAGLPGMAADIPSIITIALRTIHKIALCYGYEAITKEDKDFVLGIMAVAGANSVKEKNAALCTLKSIEVMIARQTWKKMEEMAAKQFVGKEAGVIALRKLAKQVGVNLTKRKALQAIPAIGAVVGCSANSWYIKEVGWAARRAYQERWLIDNHKIVEI